MLLAICVVFAPNVSAQTNETPLNIVTWNLYMRPRAVFHDGQVKRAPIIAEELKKHDYDVIVFQEAFDKKARNKLWKTLKDTYPYQSGKPKRKRFYKVSTGVFIVSKLPLTVVKDIFYSDCGGSDCFAVKGAVLVSLEKNKHKVQIIGTHLQAANGKKKSGTEIRKTQYMEVKEQLLIPYAEAGVPQFFVGDMNTKKEKSKEAYQQLLSDMQMEDGDITGDFPYSSGGSRNDFKSDEAQPHLIDYVLCKKNGAKLEVKQRTVKIFQRNWSKKHKDLSDHFAVEANVVLE